MGIEWDLVLKQLTIKETENNVSEIKLSMLRRVTLKVLQEF
jgi:hypothetical protein